MRRRTCAALTFLLPLTPLPTYAWGVEGHQIVAYIAASELTPAARAQISALLGGDPTAAMVQDLVLPRMRGAAAAAYSLIAIVVGSGVGPYWAGKVSKMTGSLNSGLLSILVLAPVSLLLLWLTSRRLPTQTPEARLAIARAAGEPV